MKETKLMKCKKCGLLVEVVEKCDCETTCGPLCCGEPMSPVKANTTDGAKEKHVPYPAARDSGVWVRVGSVLHPATQEHHIVWIDVISADGMTRMRKYIVPGESPDAYFPMPLEKGMEIREYCNLHGLWSYTIQ